MYFSTYQLTSHDIMTLYQTKAWSLRVHVDLVVRVSLSVLRPSYMVATPVDQFNCGQYVVQLGHDSARIHKTS